VSSGARHRDWRFAYSIAILFFLAAVSPVVEVLLKVEPPQVAFANGVFWAFVLVCVLSVWRSRGWARVARKRANQNLPAGTVWLVRARNPGKLGTTCVISGTAAGLDFQSKSNSRVLPTDQLATVGFGKSGIFDVHVLELVTSGDELIQIIPLRPDAVLGDPSAVDRIATEVRAVLQRA
jgi:hypothetical protein